MTLKLISILFMLLVLMNCSTASSTHATPNLPDFDKLWDYNDPATTEQKFREILSSFSFDQSPEYDLELRTQIARTLGLQQNLKAANTLLEEVEIALKLEYPVAKIRYLLERGRVLNSSGKREDAKPYFLKAWELGQKVGADLSNPVS